MEKEIEILKEHFGSYQAVADQLGITERHLRNVRNDDHTGEPVKKLIKALVDSIESKQTGASAP